MLFVPSGKGRKRQKKGEFRPISRKGGQTPLKPPFVRPPFAAAQLRENLHFRVCCVFGCSFFPSALSFLSLFFWKKRHGKPPKKQGFFIPAEPLNPWKRREKRSKKNKEILAGRKNKEFQKNKDRKDSKRVPNLVDVSNIFYFFRSGRAEGESEAPGRGGGRVFIENPRRGGGGSPSRGGGEGPGGCLRGILGGELHFFFFGAEMPTKQNTAEKATHLKSQIFGTVSYFQGRNRNPNPNFLVRISSGGVGVFHVKGWGHISSTV